MGESSCSIEVSQLGCVIRYGGKADRSRGGEVVCNERWRSSAAAAYLTPVRSLFLRRTQARSLDSFVPAKCVAPSFELQPWPWFHAIKIWRPPANSSFRLFTVIESSNRFSFANFKLQFNRPNHGDARLDRNIHLRRRKKNVCSTILFVWPPIIYSSLKLLICSINANGKKERKKDRERERNVYPLFPSLRPIIRSPTHPFVTRLDAESGAERKKERSTQLFLRSRGA